MVKAHQFLFVEEEVKSGERQESVRVPVNLGPKSKMTETEACQALEREITKQLGQPGSPTRITNDGSVTLEWFVNQRFIPLKEAVWKEETGNTKKILIRLDIVEPLGDIPLVDFDKFSLQLHLNELATTRSPSAETTLQQGFGNLLPNATKPEKALAVSC